MRVLLLGSASVALLLIAACGNSAVAIDLELEARATDELETWALEVRGTADPVASEFERGLMLSTRWSTRRDGEQSVELAADLDLASAPAQISRGDAPHHLTTDNGDLRVVLTQRNKKGDVILQQSAPWAALSINELRSNGARTISAGAFRLELPEDAAALYTELTAAWEPARDTQEIYLPPFAPEDGASSDPGANEEPNPGDASRPSDPGSSTGDPEHVAITHESGGCDCSGDEDEELPEESNTGDSESTEASGCDSCAGEDVDTEDPEGSGGDADSGGDGDSSDSGCDCEGETDPEEPSGGGDARLKRQSTEQLVALSTAPYSRRSPRCHRSRLQIAMEASPVFFMFLVSRRRRRTSRRDG